MENNQTKLRKLDTLLSDLKKAVKARIPEGQTCIGLKEGHVDPPTMQVFFLDDGWKMNP